MHGILSIALFFIVVCGVTSYANSRWHWKLDRLFQLCLLDVLRIGNNFPVYLTMETTRRTQAYKGIFSNHILIKTDEFSFALFEHFNYLIIMHQSFKDQWNSYFPFKLILLIYVFLFIILWFRGCHLNPHPWNPFFLVFR